MKLVVRARTLTKRITLGATAFVLAVSGAVSAVPYILSTQANAIGGTTIVSTEAELREAVGLASSATTVTFGSDIVIGSEVTIARPLTLDGNRHTLTAPFAKTNTSNNAALGVTGTSDVTVRALTVDGTGSTNLHGVNVYSSSSVSINDVTIANFSAGLAVSYGLMVNNSSVTVNNITTAHNDMGINVDKGTPHLTINGVSHHTEAVALYVDSRNKSYITDTNSQYSSFWGVYSLKAQQPDTTPPTLRLVVNGNDNLQNNAVLRDTVALEGYATDKNPGTLFLAAFKPGYEGWNDHAQILFNAAGSQTVQNWDTTTVPDGTYTLRLEAKDLAGNDAKKDVTIIIDNTVLDGSFTYSNNNGGAIVNADVVVTLTATKPIQPPEGWSPVNGSATIFTNNTFTDNTKFSVHLEDLYGAKKTIKGEVKRIDRIAPTITGVTDKQKTRGPVNFTVTDQNFSYVTINGASVKTVKAGGWNYQLASDLTHSGTYTIVAWDKAGNSTSVTVTIDTTICEAYPTENGVVYAPFTSFKTAFSLNWGMSDHSCQYGQYNDSTALWHGQAGTKWYLVYESTDGWTTTNGQVPGKTVLAVKTFTAGEALPVVSAADLGVTAGSSKTFWVHLVPAVDSFTPVVGEAYPSDAAYTRAWGQVALSVPASENTNTTDTTNNGTQTSSQPLMLTTVPVTTQTQRGAAGGVATPTTATATTTTTDTTEAVKGATDTKSATTTAHDTNQAVLGESDQKTWSLVNALAAIVMAVVGIVLLVGVFVQKEGNKHGVARILGAVVAVAAVVVFFIVEHIPSTMIWVNNWTLLMAVLAVAQIIAFAQTKHEDE